MSLGKLRQRAPACQGKEPLLLRTEPPLSNLPTIAMIQKATTEMERILCFTDVPCGGEMELKILERAFCFSDEKEADRSQVQESVQVEEQAKSVEAHDDKEEDMKEEKKEEEIKSAKDSDTGTAASRDEEEDTAVGNNTIEVPIPLAEAEDDERIIAAAANSSNPPVEGKPSRASWFGKRQRTNNNKKRAMRSRQSLWRHAQECDYDSQAFEIDESTRSSGRSMFKKGFSFRKSDISRSTVAAS
ncbi:expressed unknown protein [Seminavis robusta]|uniref:Uncharacterized protein n=1 Tax=Seminavis robusta TaxID=568900 RepID=A0A9N8H3J7_9STRA|nr:expressed unknown protein [Seminavis robusta]|eukprot:Sro27_g018470.1 n/a (244) ;mRNA; r:168914-169645